MSKIFHQIFLKSEVVSERFGYLLTHGGKYWDLELFASFIITFVAITLFIFLW